VVCGDIDVVVCVTKDRSDCSHASSMPDRPSGASVLGFERFEHDSHPGEAGAHP